MLLGSRARSGLQQALHDNGHQHNDQEAGQAGVLRLLFHAASVERDLDVHHIRLRWSKRQSRQLTCSNEAVSGLCRDFPGVTIQSVRMESRGNGQRRLHDIQRLFGLQLSLVHSGRVHAARDRHSAQVRGYGSNLRMYVLVDLSAEELRAVPGEFTLDVHMANLLFT